MTAETKQEIIKSMAYGMTDGEIHEVNPDLSLDVIATIRKSETAKIEGKKAFMKREGWFE